PYHLGGHTGQIRRHHLRLGQPVNRERSIAGPGDKCSRTTDALRSDRVPHVRRYHTNRGRRDIEVLGNHAIHLWRGLESAHAIDAGRPFEPAINAGVPQRASLRIGRRIRSVTRRKPASSSSFSPTGTSAYAGIVSMRSLSSWMSASCIDTLWIEPSIFSTPCPNVKKG